ncbi:copper resistance protein CopZ [Pseudomonas cavernicola]|uniref:Copper resistance protein CopZ n=1 Tax=Pseudomonas cavernicola TaxID=2320866 RepID=A0A418XLJ7_9PSED|nr:copper resistance protein CopZ [Pseudomonas cavernicola]RJG13343.1 copper resistance protein CopZ [Pseudomonas cavernicola]
MTQALQARDPQAEVQVDIAAGEVRVASHLPRETVAAAIREEGYAVSP